MSTGEDGGRQDIGITASQAQFGVGCLLGLLEQAVSLVAGEA